MKIQKNFLIILGAALLILGCSAKNEESGTEANVPTEISSETKTFAATDSAAALDNKPEEDGDGSFRELSQEELDTFTQFIRRRDAYGFLLSEYTNPAEADLGEVFYSGAGFDEPISDEETAAYLAASGQEELYTDCIKIPRSHAEDLVEKRLGISLEDTDASQIGLYIPELDSYFHECGDTNYMEFTCVGGLVNGSVYTLEFKTDMDWDYIYSHVQTILEETEDDYRFIANQSLSAPFDDSVECFEEPIHVETAWEYLKAACFSECSMEEISYDEGNDDFQVVLDRFELAFGSEEAERPCASVVFLEDTDEDYYRFGHYNVFYDGDTVYATQAKGWYLVNRLTGEVSIP